MQHIRFILYTAGYPVNTMTDQECLEIFEGGIC